MSAEEPLARMTGETHLWDDDKGTLTLNGRRVLLRLINGPFLDETRNPELWSELIASQDALESRCNDLLLDLVVDIQQGIAFVRNATSPDLDLPKATRSFPLTLIDTLLVLTLRRELLLTVESRTIVDREELLASLDHYRPLAKQDEAAFRKKLDQSWNKLKDRNIIYPISEDGRRFEISPALAIIFSAEETEQVAASINELLAGIQDAEAQDAAYGGEGPVLVEEGNDGVDDRSAAATHEEGAPVVDPRGEEAS